MPQSDNRRGHDYEMPPVLAYKLVSRTTFALSCRECRREVAVDVIEMVARYGIEDFDSDAVFARAKCRDCGGRMKQTGGFTLGALQHRGFMPRLITADGSDRRRPAWAAAILA